MYTVHMTRMTATEARRQLFKLLDEVEKGEEVVLERGGVRFRLTMDQKRKTAVETPESPLIVKDPDFLDRDWTWKTDDEGQLGFVERDPSG